MDTTTLQGIIDVIKVAGTMGLAILFAIGATNIILIFKPDIDSRLKIGIAFVAALIVTFVPATIANEIIKHVIMALEATIASSGVYKLFQKPVSK
jgi:hypothetical protein